ncbi:MAG: ATP-binding protein [Myxococcota bacterium]|nr:ATP-binding protein [Myxococcota bacterium]
MKYSPRGGEIRVTARRGPDGTVLTTVTDQGIGMAADQLGSIFERYVRQPGGRAQAAGHGLGLYVSAQLIKAHGGRMWAESTEGKGTALLFTLPGA